MAQDTFKRVMINLIVPLLFISLLVGFAISVGDVYGKDTSDLTSDKLNMTGVNRTLVSAENIANNWTASFTEEKGVLETIGDSIIGIFELATTMWGFITIPFQLLIQILNNVLMFPPLVTGVITFVFVVIMILAIWRLLKQGD